MNDRMRKRLTDNFELADYKEHVAELAAVVYRGEDMAAVQTAVVVARSIIDEVDRQVNKELEETPGKAGL